MPINAKDKYLIITNLRYSSSEALKDFVNYRSSEFDVVIAINSEIGIQSKQYTNYIKQQSPKYVLLVGNYKDFPSESIPYSKPVESYNYWVATQIDSLFQIEIPLGLFFVENENELSNIVSKTIKFEQNLLSMPNKLYTHSGSIESLYPWPIEFNDEILNEMFTKFFKGNGYIHQHESSLDNTSNDALRDAEAINNGVKYIIYHGHGNIPKWSFGMGVQGIEHLTNTEFFPIIFSSSCLTGTFAGKIDTLAYDCFATKMLTSKNGAVAFIGAYNESSRGQNPLLYAFSKYVNENKNNRLGDAFLKSLNNLELPETVKKYYPYVMSNEYNRARFQFHLFGDPALLINKETVNINENSNLQGKSIAPNPTSDYFHISGFSGKIEIFNHLGVKVWDGQVSEGQFIDIRKLNAGVYCVRIEYKAVKFIKL